MKLFLSIAFSLFYISSFAQQNEETTSVFVDSVSVKYFLKSVDGYDMGRKYRNELTVFGAAEKDWVTKEDIPELMTLVRSGKKCKCVVNAFSSYRVPVTEYSTLGGVAMDLIDAYRKGEAYPGKMWSCTKTDKTRAAEIEAWWAQQHK